MTMSAAVPVPTPGHWSARLQGRLRTVFKPRQLYLAAGAWSASGEWRKEADSFEAWCAEHVGERCVMGLSSQCLLHVVVRGDLSEQEAVDQAVQQWAHYLDVDAAELEAHWLLRRVKVAGQYLISAAPLALIQLLQQMARGHGVQLAWVGPWWARGVQSWMQALRHSGLQSDDAAEPVATLQARERELVVNIQASISPSRSVRLERLWVEGRVGTRSATGGVSVDLTGPAQQPGAVQAWRSQVWDHDEVAALLRGDATVWGGL